MRAASYPANDLRGQRVVSSFYLVLLTPFHNCQRPDGHGVPPAILAILNLAFWAIRRHNSEEEIARFYVARGSCSEKCQAGQVVDRQYDQAGRDDQVDQDVGRCD